MLVAVPLIMGAVVFLLTRNEPKTYASHTIVYTGIASGYNIESGMGNRSDYHAVNNAFDNLINIITMRETLEEVALRLLAGQILGHLSYPDAAVAEQLAHLRSLLPQRDLSADSLAFDVTVSLLRSEAENPTSSVHEILFKGLSPFSVETIRRNLKVKRIGSSDLIELRYSVDDPTVCVETLSHLLFVFIGKYTLLKEGEASDVISYFERQVTDANRRLQAAVEKRRAFGVQNRVINYYEQTKAIAGQKESIDETLQRERTRLAASQAALQEVERKLGFSRALMQQNEALSEKRKRLAQLSAEAILREADGRSASGLRLSIDSLKSAIQQGVSAVYAANYSKEGLTKDQLLNQWLSHVVVVAETEASVDMLEQRYAAYQKQYDVFAPLGSMLETLDRQVDIAENEYLEHLHSLNLARMRQQNIQLSSKLDIIDPPFFPLKPQASKRLQLVAVAFMAGLVLCIGGLIAREYLDQTIRTPERGETLTGLPLAAAYPIIEPDSDEASTRRLLALLTDQLVRAIKRHVRPRLVQGRPLLIAVCSHHAHEGKSYVARQLVRALQFGGTPTGFVFPEPTTRSAIQLRDDELPYLDAPGIMDIDQVHLLAQMPRPLFHAYDAIVFEAQPLLHFSQPTALLRQADVVLFVTRADRTWTPADQRSLDSLAAELTTPPLLFVNAVKTERLENLVGEVPKRRSALRRAVKRAVRFEFQARSNRLNVPVHD